MGGAPLSSVRKISHKLGKSRVIRYFREVSNKISVYILNKPNPAPASSPRLQSSPVLSDPVHPRADPSIYETVYVCHGRSIAQEYPIPAFCRPVFVKTTYIGAQKVDLYQIIQKETNNDE
jgi:hypothetical protein